MRDIDALIERLRDIASHAALHDDNRNIWGEAADALAELRERVKELESFSSAWKKSAEYTGQLIVKREAQLAE